MTNRHADDPNYRRTLGPKLHNQEPVLLIPILNWIFYRSTLLSTESKSLTSEQPTQNQVNENHVFLTITIHVSINYMMIK